MVIRRVYRLLLPKERRKAGVTLGAVFLNVLLDLAGLAAFLPILYLLLERKEGTSTVLLFCGIALAFLVGKGFVTILLSHKRQKFLLELYKRISKTLFESYYRHGLLFIREKGTLRLTQEVNGICYAFSQNLLLPILQMTGDLLLLVFVTTVLLFYDWAMVLVLYASFLPFMLVYIFVVRKRLERFGAEDDVSNREQGARVLDTFEGYVETRVYGVFPFLQERFKEGMEKICQNKMKQLTIGHLPPILSEISMVFGIFAVALMSEEEVALRIATFAICAFRLLPAMRNILENWQMMRDAKYCVQTLEEAVSNLKEQVEPDNKEMPFERCITLCDVTFAYPNAEPVFEHYNCTIHKGEIVAVGGNSGRGKSTILNLLTGLLQPNEGQILIDDTPLTESNQEAWIRLIGYVPQEVFIFNQSVAENIALANPVDEERITYLLQRVGLGEWLEGLPDGLHTLLTQAGVQLSGGQRQRVGIARALYKRAELLLLDEATSALDLDTEKAILQLLHDVKNEWEDLTIVYNSHKKEIQELCDRVIRI